MSIFDKLDEIKGKLGEIFNQEAPDPTPAHVKDLRQVMATEYDVPKEINESLYDEYSKADMSQFEADSIKISEGGMYKASPNDFIKELEHDFKYGGGSVELRDVLDNVGHPHAEDIATDGNKISYRGQGTYTNRPRHEQPLLCSTNPSNGNRVYGMCTFFGDSDWINVDGNNKPITKEKVEVDSANNIVSYSNETKEMNFSYNSDRKLSSVEVINKEDGSSIRQKLGVDGRVLQEVRQNPDSSVDTIKFNEDGSVENYKQLPGKPRQIVSAKRSNGDIETYKDGKLAKTISTDGTFKEYDNGRLTRELDVNRRMHEYAEDGSKVITLPSGPKISLDKEGVVVGIKRNGIERKYDHENGTVTTVESRLNSPKVTVEKGRFKTVQEGSSSSFYIGTKKVKEDKFMKAQDKEKKKIEQQARKELKSAQKQDKKQKGPGQP